jgi:hypothetical protein
MSATLFYFYLSGLFLNFRTVRNIIILKIGAFGEYLKFIACVNTNSEVRLTRMIFTPEKLICARRIKLFGAKYLGSHVV